ncbi:MAG: glycosyltransferase [Treponema sp.]|nr:glycosyltransferase [Treponema sp.]
MIDRTEEEIMREWGVDNSDNPLVSVRCITYNHEPYIAQALDGFLMQKTNFPFEVIVHDDASTDRTADIVREYEKKYPKIIKAIYQTENQYSKQDGSIGRIMNAACKGEYIALCEGDDYWIDENKLQMQVDFLEKNSEYGMCYTKANVYIQKEQNFRNGAIGAAFDSFDDLVLKGNRVPTLTTVYRRDLLDRYWQEVQPGTRGWLMGDYPMWLYFAHESKVKFFNHVTSVYRVLEESASNSQDPQKRAAFVKSTEDIQFFFAQKYYDNAAFAEYTVKKQALEEERRVIAMFSQANIERNRDDIIKYGKIIPDSEKTLKIRLKLFLVRFPLVFKLVFERKWLKRG